MLTIRRAQMDALEREQCKHFEAQMTLHLNTWFAEDIAEFGADGLSAFIHHGIKRAALYNIVTEKDVCRYIDLMVVLGQWFDCEQVFPWVEPILTDVHERSADERLTALEESVATWSMYVE